MSPASRSRRGREGVVLVAVLFFVLLTTSVVATFLRRATVDGLMVRNRDGARRCEALARGGVRLATALLLEDRLQEANQEFRVETREDVWAAISGNDLNLPDGGRLNLQIEDAGARLNLNALFQGGAPRDALTEVLLIELLTKVIDENPEETEGQPLEPEDLARNLIDYVDQDDLRQLGGDEDSEYQARRPPERAANRPLLTIGELGRIEGFTPQVVEALRPYVTVHPWVAGDGINPNTAPPWVLALLYHGTSGDFRMVGGEVVSQILDIREQGGILCADEADHEVCTPIREAVPDEVYPPPAFTADVFYVRSRAHYGSLERTVEAVVDRSNPADPLILAWRVE